MCIVISTTEEHACFLELKGIIPSDATAYDISYHQVRYILQVAYEYRDYQDEFEGTDRHPLLHEKRALGR